MSDLSDLIAEWRKRARYLPKGYDHEVQQCARELEALLGTLSPDKQCKFYDFGHDCRIHSLSAKARTEPTDQQLRAIELLREIVATGVKKGDRIEVTLPPYERALDFIEALGSPTPAPPTCPNECNDGWLSDEHPTNPVKRRCPDCNAPTPPTCPQCKGTKEKPNCPTVLRRNGQALPLHCESPFHAEPAERSHSS